MDTNIIYIVAKVILVYKTFYQPTIIIQLDVIQVLLGMVPYQRQMGL